jgi:hypothetical protein
MYRHQEEESGSLAPPGDDSTPALEQQRRSLAEDIALLVVRQFRRSGIPKGHRADATRQSPSDH